MDVPHIELDALADTYYRRAGYDAKRGDALERQLGYVAKYRYREPVFPESIRLLFEEHHDCVFDLGAGHTCMLDTALIGRVQEQFAPFTNVVLLLPSRDPERSIAVIRERLRGDPQRAGDDWDLDGVDFIRLWVTSDQNQRLATHLVFTEEHSPEQIAAQIFRLLGDR
jgi:hypothetical protein